MCNPITLLKNKIKNMPLPVKASVAYTGCSVFQRCLSFITLPLFTRLLTTDEYGLSTIYGSWNGILSIILTLNLAYGSFGPAMIKFETERDGYISSVEGICLLLSAIFIVIYLPLQTYWNKFFDLSTGLVLLLVCELLCSTAILLWMGKARFEYRYKSVVFITGVMSVLSPVGSYLLICHASDKGVAKILGNALVYIIFGGSLFLINEVRGKKLYCKKFWKYALGFNIPLLVYYLSQIIFNQSDRLMINYFCGRPKAAIYGVAYTLATLLIFILNAINNSYEPWFLEKIKKGNEKDNANVSIGIAVLMAALILLVILGAPEIVLIMAGQQYTEAIWIVPPVAISLLLLFYAQLFVNALFYFEQKYLLVLGAVGAAVLNIVLNAIFIPVLGYLVAGYTTLASYIAFAIAYYYILKRIAPKYGFNMAAYNIKMLIVLFIAFTFLSFCIMWLYKFLYVRYGLVMVLGIILIFNSEKIYQLKEKYLSK